MPSFIELINLSTKDLMRTTDSTTLAEPSNVILRFLSENIEH